MSPRYPCLLAALILLGTAVAAQPAQPRQFGDEPAFLENIGPQDVRTDNPLAAIVTAFVVGLVFYRGFRKFSNTRNEQREPAPDT